MTELLEVYKCEKCGNIVKVIHAGGGQLVCCGVPMIKMEEKTADTGKEKHVPVLEKVEGGVKVKVGSVPHPMEENHHIEWIEVRSGSKICVHKLNPGDAPEAIFPIDDVDAKVRIYCNIHGLWTNRK